MGEGGERIYRPSLVLDDRVLNSVCGLPKEHKVEYLARDPLIKTLYLMSGEGNAESLKLFVGREFWSEFWVLDLENMRVVRERSHYKLEEAKIMTRLVQKGGEATLSFTFREFYGSIWIPPKDGPLLCPRVKSPCCLAISLEPLEIS